MPAVSEGVLPSVVYRRLAPLVAEVIITDCAVVKLPPPGLNTGAATCGNDTPVVGVRMNSSADNPNPLDALFCPATVSRIV